MGDLRATHGGGRSWPSTGFSFFLFLSPPRAAFPSPLYYLFTFLKLKGGGGVIMLNLFCICRCLLLPQLWYFVELNSVICSNYITNSPSGISLRFSSFNSSPLHSSKNNCNNKTLCIRKLRQKCGVNHLLGWHMRVQLGVWKGFFYCLEKCSCS